MIAVYVEKEKVREKKYKLVVQPQPESVEEVFGRPRRDPEQEPLNPISAQVPPT